MRGSGAFCETAFRLFMNHEAVGSVFGPSARLCAARQADPALEVTVDLARQVVEWAGQAALSFPVDPFARHCLLEGVDELGYLLSLQPEIEAYEARR